MKNKNLYKFTTFAIKECLLKNAISFAEQHTAISEISDKTIIFQARKSLLFIGQHVWIKKEGGLFDVTMGAFDGAEVCGAVGNFLLFFLIWWGRRIFGGGAYIRGRIYGILRYFFGSFCCFSS